MSGPIISNLAQFNYMIQWFEEWSELQRQDFIPILAEKMASNGLYINGLVEAITTVTCQDKPLSLFQCRVKLFNTWFPNWTAEERNKLVTRLSEIDETFGVKLHEELSGNKQVVDNEFSADEGLVTAVPGNVISESSCANGVEADIENKEVLDAEEETPQMVHADNQIPIQIAE